MEIRSSSLKNSKSPPTVPNTERAFKKPKKNLKKNLKNSEYSDLEADEEQGFKTLKQNLARPARKYKSSRRVAKVASKTSKRVITSKNSRRSQKRPSSISKKKKVITRGVKEPFSRIPGASRTLVIKTKSKAPLRLKVIANNFPNFSENEIPAITEKKNKTVSKGNKIKYCNSFNKAQYLLYRHFQQIGEWVRVQNPEKADYTPFTNENHVNWEIARLSLVNLK